MLPNASCLKSLMKTNRTPRPSTNRTCTETLDSHCRSVLFWKQPCLMTIIRPALSALQCKWNNQMQITQWIYGGWGSRTHADKNMGFFLKSSTRLMNRIPMLTISPFRFEPPITSRARRALHHLNEVLANLRLLIASPPICHQPLLSWAFNI